jgi:LuxR family maltose regulon positive regulatory protein
VSTENSVYTGVSAAGIIHRQALIEKMKKISMKKNIYISAPGGYGKSVAAAQWLSFIRGKKAVMAIIETDNNPENFYKRLAENILKLVKGSAVSAPEAGVSFDGLLEIIKKLPPKSPRCYLFIDDAHILKHEEIIRHMPIIAKRLPGYICCCLAGRAEPNAGLLETGLYEVLDIFDLVFSPEEIEWLVAGKKHVLTDADIKELLRVTGGWAIYLSALLSGEGFAADKKVSKSQTLNQYFESRVWNLWDDAAKRLLLKLSVPTDITPELCERLTGAENGSETLNGIVEIGNAFLSQTGADTYRFHDLFRDFLTERVAAFLGEEETRRVNDIAAVYYYGQGDYYAGVKHYIQNSDHEGINRCMEATNQYNMKSGNLSVEIRLNFTMQVIKKLSPEFIAENPFLITRCAVTAHNNGDREEFVYYTDMLYSKMPEIAVKYPSLIATIVMFMGVDYRIPLCEYVKRIADMMPHMAKHAVSGATVRVGTMTQNLPFFHRSFRDLSEIHDTKDDDIKAIQNTLGVIIGKSYEILEKCAFAGFCYEHGELLEAASWALTAFQACESETQPEVLFHVYTILSSVLYAMGAVLDAEKIMKKTEEYIKTNARFLYPNFKALQTERIIREGNAEAAREWLMVFAGKANHLPFYQICRHFTTLRSHIAVGDHATAVSFGKRLQVLAYEYNRPLDQIESGILTAIALFANKKDEAVKLLEKTLSIAEPYGFTQLFINEGKELLPILLELNGKAKKTSATRSFADGLIDRISIKERLNSFEDKMPKLSEQQQAMLVCLSKGMTYNEIAEAAGLGRGTVKSHVLLLYKRLDVSNSREAVIKARLLGLLK